MATALKDQYGPDVPQAICHMVHTVYPAFDHTAFMADALRGYADLELMPRGKHIAHSLRQHLPADYPQALAILLASCNQPHQRDMRLGLASFLYLPHTLFVAHYGLGHFVLSMQAQHALTQRFTAEFSIRPFLEQFQKDPAPVLELLECLKDDPDLYVRRSVTNNLNDIGKEHPALLADTARRWLQGASPQRRWIVKHALRYAVKRGEPDALSALGYGAAATVELRNILITPQQVQSGQSVTIAFDVVNLDDQAIQILVDLCVHYVKVNGQTRPKVFKLKTLNLPAGGSAVLRKVLSLQEMSTRKHYPGVHPVTLLVNGQAQVLGEFEFLAITHRHAEQMTQNCPAMLQSAVFMEIAAIGDIKVKNLVSGLVGGDDLRRFHGQLRRGLLMHRKGRLALFFKLQFPGAILGENVASEIHSRLDLAEWFADAPPNEIGQHLTYSDVLDSLTIVMNSAHVALERASAGQLDADTFSTLVQSLQEFDRCADILDAEITNSLTDVDALTGLFNRAALDRDLNRELAKAARNGKPLSVAMIDADKFKVVNDTYGHSFGDVVLSKLAERFMESLRPSDLLYRYGGEEFLMLLPDTSPDQAHSVLDRLRKRASSSPISKGAVSITQSVSVGIAMHTADESPVVLVTRADDALYSAKSQGRNRVVVAPST
jgi:diguanylate cyclase (GGDEF)-like protein